MRVVVAMSGGVDSSVAAALLARAGHEVIGLSMQLYDQSGSHGGGEVRFGTCCTIDDLHDARRVASTLGIPHYIVNFERQFDETVVSNFVREYAAGRTPIPCVHCNGDLKFATLAERAEGAERGIRRDRALRAGRAGRRGTISCSSGASMPAKDQSYFLFTLTQAQLAHAMFPVGSLDKAGRPRPGARARPASRRRSRTATKSASCQTAITRRSSSSTARPPRRARFTMSSGKVVGTPRRRASLHGRPAQGTRSLLTRSALRRRHRRRRAARSRSDLERRWSAPSSQPRT